MYNTQIDTAYISSGAKAYSPPKIGWLKRIIAAWLIPALKNHAAPSYDNCEGVRTSTDISSPTNVRFTIHPANGGYVIEHYTYKRFEDGPGPSLTLVSHGENIGTAIERIITMEAIRA